MQSVPVVLWKIRYTRYCDLLFILSFFILNMKICDFIGGRDVDRWVQGIHMSSKRRRWLFLGYITYYYGLWRTSHLSEWTQWFSPQRRSSRRQLLSNLQMRYRITILLVECHDELILLFLSECKYFTINDVQYEVGVQRNFFPTLWFVIWYYFVYFVWRWETPCPTLRTKLVKILWWSVEIFPVVQQ